MLNPHNECGKRDCTERLRDLKLDIDMIKEPLLSIIVPVYKVEPYLGKCIQSILDQDFDDFELILVDDGSPDRCGAICDEYAQKDDRIKVIHKENGGLSSARNAGLDVVRGTFVSFVDSDDYLSSDFYKANIAYLQEHSEVDMIVMPIVLVEEKGGTETFFAGNLKPCMIKGKEEVIDFLWSGHFLLLQSAIYRTSLWKEIRFPLGMVHEDSYILPDLAERVNQVKVSNVGIHYYLKREGAITSTRDLKKMRDMMKVAFYGLDYLKQYSSSYIYNHRLLGFIYLLWRNKSLLPREEYKVLRRQLATYPLNKKAILASSHSSWKEKLFLLSCRFI